MMISGNMQTTCLHSVLLPPPQSHPYLPFPIPAQNPFPLHFMYCYALKVIMAQIRLTNMALLDLCLTEQARASYI